MPKSSSSKTLRVSVVLLAVVLASDLALLLVAEKQSYLCAVSETPLPPTKASLERVDESKTYTISNTTMINVDFQSATQRCEEDVVPGITGASQWSTTKYRRVGEIRSGKNVSKTDFNVWNRARGRATSLTTRKETILRKRLSTAVSGARTHTMRRNRFRRKIGKAEHCKSEITKEFLIQLFLDQKGLCAYTKVPMNINGNFKFTVERKNVDIGYCCSNVCLVCAEVNHANAKWSPDKADRYWGPIVCV